MDPEWLRRRLARGATVDLTAIEERHQPSTRPLTPALRTCLEQLAEEARRSPGQAQDLYALARDEPDDIYGPLVRVGLNLDALHAGPRLALAQLTTLLLTEGYDPGEVARVTALSGSAPAG